MMPNGVPKPSRRPLQLAVNGPGGLLLKAATPRASPLLIRESAVPVLYVMTTRADTFRIGFPCEMQKARPSLSVVILIVAVK